MSADPAVRTAALEALLVEKGLLSTDAIDAVVEHYERDLGPQHGARVVARAWVDPDFRARLLADGTAAVSELGISGFELNTLVAVGEHARGPQPRGLHAVLLLPVAAARPAAQVVQAPAYRARAVAEPRAVLREFGVELPPDTTIRVWDSTSEVRYLVVPRRPPGSEHLDEEELAALVSRDAMVGTAA